MERAPRIWIIGASSGIGRALALDYARAGVQVILSARERAALEEVAREGGGGQVLAFDLADRGALAEAIDALSDAPLDAIINAAALYEPSRVEDIAPEALEALIAVNLTAVFALAQAAPKLLRASGQLVLFGSVAGYVGLPRGQPYSASKAAIANLAETLRVELAPQVDVRLVSPGFVRTRLTDKNPFKMPAIISAEEAAREVVAGLKRRGFEIHFPKRFTWAMKFLRALPYPVKLALTARLGRKP